MRVVIAPDSLKGTAAADEAARAIGEGWLSIRPDDDVVNAPQADGGEGTLQAIASTAMSARWFETTVTGPDGRPANARWILLPDDTAVVELAESSGLPLMRELDPLGSTTRGLGEVIAAVLSARPRALVVGLGGSASTDGGAGALQALGAELRDSLGNAIPDGGAALARLASLDLKGLPATPPGGIQLLTDVTNPLLGPLGAATAFGPQKGATPPDVALLEGALNHWADWMGSDPQASGMGAAGGTAYGLAAGWGAVIVPGSAEVAKLTGLPLLARDADVLITGEGQLDATSFSGKVVGHTVGLAGATTQTIVIAGVIAVKPDDHPTLSLISLTELAGSSRRARDDATRWLREAGAAAARSQAG